MLRRSIAAALVLFVLGGFVMAETLRGQLVSLDGTKAKVKVFKSKKDKEGEEKEFTVASSAKYMKGGKKGTEPTEVAVEDVKKAIGTKGATVTIEVADDGEHKGKITKITVGGRRKKAE